MTDEILESKIEFIDELHRDVLALKAKVKNRGYPEELLLSDFRTSLSLFDKARRAFVSELVRRKAKREKAALTDLNKVTT